MGALENGGQQPIVPAGEITHYFPAIFFPCRTARAAKLKDAAARKAAWAEFCAACDSVAESFPDTKPGKEFRQLAAGLAPYPSTAGSYCHWKNGEASGARTILAPVPTFRLRAW